VRSVLNLWFLNMQLVYMFRIPRPKGIVGVSLHMLKVPHLLEKGRGMPRIVGMILYMLRERGRDASPRQTNNKSLMI